MNSLRSFILFTIPLFITLHLLSPSSSFFDKNLPDSSRGLSCEEKTRLGSTPPSCYNKCRQCHPCMAVQVPTLPSHDRVRPGLIPTDYFGSSANRYSNYKPLGWKCRCGNHFYNP